MKTSGGNHIRRYFMILQSFPQKVSSIQQPGKFNLPMQYFHLHSNLNLACQEYLFTYSRFYP